MSLYFENQGTNTYLVYAFDAKDELDTMSLGMLTNNIIPGFAAASFMQMDLSKYVKYNVSSKVSASQLFSGMVNKKRLLGVFSGIAGAMMAAEDYMLDPNCVLLDLDYIFTDVTTCETVLICLPIMNTENKQTDLGKFFKNIIFNTQYDQTENCDHVAQILNYLNSNPVLNLLSFKELLDRLSKDTPAAQPVQQVAPIRPVQQSMAQQPVVQQPAVQQPVEQKPVAPQTTLNKPQAPSHTPVAKPVQQPKVAQPAPAAPQNPEEKPMSMFYLLQHYNKDNAALYKAQQEAKKANKANKAAAAAPAPQPAKQKAAPKQTNVGFAVPGKPEQPAASFAVPAKPDQPAAPVSQPAKPAAKAAPAHQPAPATPSADFCANCGKPMQPGRMFCPHCGTRRVDVTAPTAVPTPASVATPVAAPIAQQPVAQYGNQISFGETTVLSGTIGETTVLGAAPEATKVEPYLVRVKNNEKIPLNKPVFRIGKERSYVDYFIGDNTAISRSHANILNRNGEYFVVDTNSTNHTYVNGSMIQSNVETKLSHGAKIRLANEDFTFNIY